MRAVAYRQFSRLVYGFLGKKRIPLPACAYTIIRGSLQSARQRGVRGTVRGVRGMRGTQKIKKNLKNIFKNIKKI